MKVAPWPGLLATAMSPSDCLAKPNAWLRPRPVPLPTSLVVKNGSKIVSSSSGAMPLPVSATVMATKSPLRAGCARRGGMLSTLRTPMVSRPSPSMASRLLTARLISAVSNCAMSAIAKQFAVRYLDVDPDPAADEGTDELGHGLDLRADIEHLRLQRLPARECQQLSGQLGGALHGFGNRVDVAAAAFLRQFAAAQEVGRGADDGQEIVEIVRHAAGQLPDRFHLLRLAQRFLALAALCDIDGVRHRADDGAVLVAQRPHREVEIALAARQAQQHLGLDFLALHHRMEGLRTVRPCLRSPENHGVSQNGLPSTSLASARIPASAVLLAYSTSPCRLSRP